MRTTSLVFALAAAAAAVAQTNASLPTTTPATPTTTHATTPTARLLGPGLIVAAVDGSACPANYYSCEGQGSRFDGLCCPFSAACVLDGDSNPACCPAGDVCTGRAPTTYVTATVPASYVADADYPSFPYLVPAYVVATTALANAAACAAVLGQCTAEYEQCTSSLAANARPTTTFYSSSVAASLCSSLQGVACGGLPTNSAGCSSLFARSTRSAAATSDSGGSRGPAHLPLAELVALAATLGFVLAGAGLVLA